MQYGEWTVNDILLMHCRVPIALGLFALTIGTIFGVAVGTWRRCTAGDCLTGPVFPSC